VIELKAKLKERGLPVSGKKTDLITRLKTEKEVAAIEKYIHNCNNCKQKLKIPVGYEGRIKCPSCDSSTSISTESDN
jgi:rRNA maturation endonuclease Nob1